MDEIKIRKATTEDFEELYALGRATPEINVSDTLPFMGPNEFKNGLRNLKIACFVAESNEKIIGFIYGDIEDKDLDEKTWAALMYIAVAPEFRGQGVAKKLYDSFEAEMKGRGANILYSWANAEEGAKIIPFFTKQGLKPGHLYRWMEKEL
jgi:GNAT superfamily N-acetyltransferase